MVAESLQEAIAPLCSAAVVTVGAQINPTPRAIMVSANATITVDMIDQGEDVQLTLLAGVVYPFRIRKVATSSATVTALW